MEYKMKKLIIISVLIIWGLIGAQKSNAQPGVSNYFYTGLTPYGSWIEIDYGVVVWRPTAMRLDWSPYREGRWIWTSDGWYWHSYEPFGYITYHYGRWYYDDFYGWLWVPGYEYAPAWVEWRYDDNYIGWAPLHPYANVYIAIGVVYPNVYYNPYYQWNFVTYNHFCDPYVYNYYISPRYKYRVHSNTRYRTNYVNRNGRIRNQGIDINIVRTRSGQNIQERDLIRVPDERTLNGNDQIERDKIRTVYKSRDELIRNEVRDTKIKKSEHRTSLDLSRVQIPEIKERKITNSNINDKSNEVKTRTNIDRQYSVTPEKKTESYKQVVPDKNNMKTPKERNQSGLNNGTTEKRNINNNSSVNKNEQNQNNNTKKQEMNIKENNKRGVQVNTNSRNQSNNQKTVSNEKKPENNNIRSNNNRMIEKSNSEKKNNRTPSKR